MNLLIKQRSFAGDGGSQGGTGRDSWSCKRLAQAVGGCERGAEVQEARWRVVEELVHRKALVTLKEEEGRIKVLASQQKKAFQINKLWRHRAIKYHWSWPQLSGTVQRGGLGIRAGADFTQCAAGVWTGTAPTSSQTPPGLTKHL